MLPDDAADWSKWPRLSRTLQWLRHPERCTSCGALVHAATARWRECDDFDRPTGPIVVCCDRCERKVIKPHPRLYAQADRFEPIPGTEAICVDCPHRQGLACTRARANGGPGVVLTYPKPTVMHVLRSPRSQSGWLKLYPGPVESCDGREVCGG